METVPLTELCDNAQLNRFHKRLVVYSAGGPFLDGYVMGMIGIALVQITPYMGLSLFWEGMVGAGTLVGMFFGGFLGGLFTDKYGRQLLYSIDLIALALFSLAQFWAETGLTFSSAVCCWALPWVRTIPLPQPCWRNLPRKNTAAPLSACLRPCGLWGQAAPILSAS